MKRIGERMIEPAGEAWYCGAGGRGPSSAAALAGSSVSWRPRATARRWPARALQPFGRPASGGMVLVLDDMGQSVYEEISVRGTCLTMIERLAKLKLATFPRQHEWGELPESYRRWARWGTFDFHSHKTPYPICFAASCDPDGCKSIALEWVEELGIELRLHSWFSRALVEDGQIKGVICETKAGREAILGDVVIDATGDLDVATSAGAPYVKGSYIMTTVFRLGGVDTDAAERFEIGQPAAFAELDKQAKKMIGGSWAHWWLKTPLPGVVWCNCPHMPGLDGLRVEPGAPKYRATSTSPLLDHAPAICRNSSVAVSSTSRAGRRPVASLGGVQIAEIPLLRVPSRGHSPLISTMPKQSKRCRRAPLSRRRARSREFLHGDGRYGHRRRGTRRASGADVDQLLLKLRMQRNYASRDRSRRTIAGSIMIGIDLE